MEPDSLELAKAALNNALAGVNSPDAGWALTSIAHGLIALTEAARAVQEDS